MTRKQLEKTVIAIVYEATQEKPTLESRLIEDLGADELEMFRIVMPLEEVFNIEIPEEVEKGWQTVGDIVKWLRRN